MIGDVEVNGNQWVSIEGSGRGCIRSQSVEANLLVMILNKLEEIRCGLIDIETIAQEKR